MHGKISEARRAVEMLHLFTFALLFGTVAGCTAENDGLVPKYQEVVTAIQKGDISPDANGMVVLPPSKHGLVIGDTVYVTGLRKGSRQYLFSTWRGKASNLRGYLYCEGAQPTIGKEIQVRCFIAGPPFAGENGVMVERGLGSGWYYVSRSLD
jgi:hypothetical protein